MTDTPRPPDLPDPGPIGASFGIEHTDDPSWVPEPAAGATSPSVGVSGTAADQAESVADGSGGDESGGDWSGGDGSDGDGSRGDRSGGFRLANWHLVVIGAAVFVPLLVWFAASLASGNTPTPAPSTSTPARSALPTSALTTTPSDPASATTDTPIRTIPLPQGTRTVVIPGPSQTAPTSRPPLATRPTLERVPPANLTPVPPGAKTMRFEAHGPKGLLLEVSLSDAQHQRYDFPPEKGPVAFDVPVPSAPSASDYFSIRVRAPYSSSGERPDVMCRIYVDDILVTSQQGQGYASCYISPYYDVRRT